MGCTWAFRKRWRCQRFEVEGQEDADQDEEDESEERLLFAFRTSEFLIMDDFESHPEFMTLLGRTGSFGHRFQYFNFHLVIHGIKIWGCGWLWLKGTP